MNVLEKILEEIEEATFQEDAPIYIGNMEVDGYVRASRVKDIIRSHMNEKEKVTSAEIISRKTDGKPYYGIKYKKVGEDHYTVGYSSYYLDYVIDWLNNCFEFCGESKIVVNVGKDTNVPSNDGWIPVEERLPEDCEEIVLVQVSGKPADNARNTMKILPIEASYLSHALQVFHIPDMYNLPILQFLQAVILLFLSAHRNLRPEA